VIVFAAENTQISMKGPFDDSNIIQFINDNTFPLLSSWSLPSIKSLSKLFVSVFAMTWEEIEEYRELAKSTFAVFTWGSAVNWTELEVAQFNLTLNQFPAILVIDPINDRYFSLPNAVDVTATEKWLKKFDGEVEDLPNMELNVKPKERVESRYRFLDQLDISD
jgi:hypothetical protein